MPVTAVAAIVAAILEMYVSADLKNKNILHWR